MLSSLWSKHKTGDFIRGECVIKAIVHPKIEKSFFYLFFYSPSCPSKPVWFQWESKGT